MTGRSLGPARGVVASLALLLACGPDASEVVTSAAPATDVTATPTASTSAVASASSSAGVDATSGASPAYDTGGGTVVVGGSVDGAALRKRHRERISKDTSPVTVLRGNSARELGEAICRAAMPDYPAATPVLLKPNICGIDAMQDPGSHEGDDGVRGRITDPEFVRGVVRCLRARGTTKITIAEGCSLNHAGFEKLLAVSGYARMAKEESVPIVGLNDDGIYDTMAGAPGKPLRIEGIADTEVPTLLMPTILAEHLDHGVFVSLPKLKTHRYSVVSLSIKGMQGTVMTSDGSPAHRQKSRMHRELAPYLDAAKPGTPDDRAKYVESLRTFSERMAAVLEISAPDVVLAEGAPAVTGNGFDHLRPVAEKIAIGGTNPIAVDKVGAQFLGLWKCPELALGLRGIDTSPLITAAAARFGVDLEKVTITGDGADLVTGPRPVHFKAIAPFAIDVPAKR